MKKDNKGFTLVEILAVVVILALIMVVVGTKGFGAFNNTKEKIVSQNEAMIKEAANILKTEIEYCDETIKIKDGLNELKSDKSIEKINVAEGESYYKCETLKEIAKTNCFQIPISYLINNNYITGQGASDFKTNYEKNSGEEYSVRLCMCGETCETGEGDEIVIVPPEEDEDEEDKAPEIDISATTMNSFKMTLKDDYGLVSYEIIGTSIKEEFKTKPKKYEKTITGLKTNQEYTIKVCDTNSQCTTETVTTSPTTTKSTENTPPTLEIKEITKNSVKIYGFHKSGLKGIDIYKNIVSGGYMVPCDSHTFNGDETEGNIEFKNLEPDSTYTVYVKSKNGSQTYKNFMTKSKYYIALDKSNYMEVFYPESYTMYNLYNNYSSISNLFLNLHYVMFKDGKAITDEYGVFPSYSTSLTKEQLKDIGISNCGITSSCSSNISNMNKLAFENVKNNISVLPKVYLYDSTGEEEPVPLNLELTNIKLDKNNNYIYGYYILTAKKVKELTGMDQKKIEFKSGTEGHAHEGYTYDGFKSKEGYTYYYKIRIRLFDGYGPILVDNKYVYSSSCEGFGESIPNTTYDNVDGLITDTAIDSALAEYMNGYKSLTWYSDKESAQLTLKDAAGNISMPEVIFDVYRSESSCSEGTTETESGNSGSTNDDTWECYHNSVEEAPPGCTTFEYCCPDFGCETTSVAC